MKKRKIYTMVITAALNLLNKASEENFRFNEWSPKPIECEHKEFFNQFFEPQPPEPLSMIDYLIQSGDIERLNKINPAYLRLDRRYDRKTYLNLLRDLRSASDSSCVQEKPAHIINGAVVCF